LQALAKMPGRREARREIGNLDRRRDKIVCGCADYRQENASQWDSFYSNRAARITMVPRRTTVIFGMQDTFDYA
jgi:hypothetical protein